jgi:hypothetical protein
MVKFGIFLPVNSNYYIHLQGLLYSFSYLLDEEYKIHIIDMGLKAKQREHIFKQFPQLKVQIDDIFISTNDIHTYRFKIKTIENMLNYDYDICIMLDAKNHLKYSLSQINSILDRVLINQINCVEKDWTHDTCLKEMETTEEIKNSGQYQSNNPVFRMAVCADIINDIVKFGLNDNCLCPEGSKKSFEGDSRHRQDQSVISITLKKHGIKPSRHNYSSYHNTITIL